MGGFERFRGACLRDGLPPREHLPSPRGDDLAAWFAGQRGPFERSRTSGVAGASAVALLTVLVVGASGAVTALGDTLVFTAGIDPGESALVAKLVASRFYHPATALLAFAAVVSVVLWLRPRVGERARRHGMTAVAVFAAQLLLGAVNVFLKAPVWMQLVHLAAADLLWILLVLMTAEAITTARRSPPSAIFSN